VYVDGGIRTGADVLVALAAGARAVLVGRLAAYALAVGGAEGVRRAVETLRAELLETAALCGTTTLRRQA
jgi:4-hydroxymandelate oxidase